MNKVYLSLGSNIGDRLAYLKRAICLLMQNSDLSNVILSSFYETAPQGYTDQDYFVNCVVGFETDLEPMKLLRVCQKIEKDLKRVWLFRWGPRTIDLDILTYGNIEMDDKELEIPHPRMLERAFVMVPLSELEPKYLELSRLLEGQEITKID